MPHTQINASQQCVQPHVAGPYDPQLHQTHVPQQQVQLHQGPYVYNTMPQVQPQHQYNTHNTYAHSTQPHSYDASFPALPERSESPWHRVHKGHETTQNLIHNTSRYSSQTITGLTNHCPYSQIRLIIRRLQWSGRGKTPTTPTQSTTHIRVGSTKHSTPQRVTCNCDGKRLRT